MEQNSTVEQRAAEIYDELYERLNHIGNGDVIGTDRLMQYAWLTARWEDCEKKISEHGYLAKHPRTEKAVISPYVEMSFQYMKQANFIWSELWESLKRRGWI